MHILGLVKQDDAEHLYTISTKTEKQIFTLKVTNMK